MAALEEQLFASGLPVEALMEKAALAVAQRLMQPDWWPRFQRHGALVLVGPGGLVRDMVMPYRDPVYVWRRQTLAEVIQITGDDLLVIEQWTESMDCVFLWGLLHRVAPVHWMKTAPDRLEPVDRVWVFCQENADTSQAGLMADRPGWREVESRRFDYLPAKPDKMGNLRCTLRLFENGGP